MLSVASRSAPLAFCWFKDCLACGLGTQAVNIKLMRVTREMVLRLLVLRCAADLHTSRSTDERTFQTSFMCVYSFMCVTLIPCQQNIALMVLQFSITVLHVVKNVINKVLELCFLILVQKSPNKLKLNLSSICCFANATPKHWSK
ncbi:hypothetical protein AVEN_100059-1 [Araneus ventricosus]|uniref:Uncharacterized protein n=1 Tax=Araneus ventricosus TaxID=182803 RepID=A0A4Y2QQ69_ARAVE|nr:hypothetical protein AVEN_100059-1 [Araneus ventricosus]